MHLHLSTLPQVEPPAGAPVALAPRDAVVLAWLAIEGPTTRARMATLLWPASSDAQARSALRQRLLRLNKVVGADLVGAGPVLQLHESLSHDLVGAAELLGELRLPDAPELDSWLQAQREQRVARERDDLLSQAQALEDAGEANAALPVAKALLRREPLSEAAHRRVMRLHYLLGDRAAALQAFDACEQLLKDEVGTRPSGETLALLATIERVAPPAPPLGRRPMPASVLRPPRLIGRDGELRAVQTAWQAGQVVSITGEAGMGKSRLLQELALAEPGVVVAQARPGDAVVPYTAVARLLRAVIARSTASSLPLAPASPLARLLPETGTATPHGVTAAPLQRAALIQAMADLLQDAMCQGLSTLVLDDLHFADEASIELMQSLTGVEQLAGLHFAFAARPAEGPAAAAALIDALLESRTLMPVELVALTVLQMRELVDSLGLEGVHGESLAAQLHRHTGGNPLFALETLRQGLVDADLGSGDLPRPMSVARLIERRLARLSSQAVMLARCAAVAMPDFSIELAAFALEQPALQLVDAWHELELAQVLRESAFAHDLVFEAVLGSVPKPIASHTHARVATFLAQQHCEPARIAEHWLKAGRPMDALPWLKAAAEGAGQAGRGKEQCEFLLRAVEVEEHFGSRDDAFETAWRVFQSELFEFMPEPLDLAATLERLAHDDRQYARAYSTHAWLLTRYWRLDECTALANKSLVFAERTGEVELINEARHGLAMFAAIAGRHHEAQPWFEQIIESLRATGSAAPSDFYNNYAMTLDRQGRVREALPLWEQALVIVLAAGGRTALLLSNLAINRQFAGQFRLAGQHATESLRLYARDEAAIPERCSVTLTLARNEHVLGHWRQALALVDGTERALLPTQTAFAASVKLRKAECWLDLGQGARALGILSGVDMEPRAATWSGAPALCEIARSRRWHGQPLGDCLERARELLPDGHAPNHLRVLIERGYFEPAERVAEATERIISEAQALGMEGYVMAAWTLRAARLREVAPALAVGAAEQALEMSATIDSFGFYKPELWWHAARAFDAVGQGDRAAGCVQRAVAWISERVQQGDVPPEFIDSFLHRNPVNRELLTWASRLGTVVEKMPR